MNDESWTITLTPEQLEELDAVITPHVVGRDWRSSPEPSLHLLSWTSLLGDLCQRLEGGIGFARLRGLDLWQHSVDEARWMLWAIGTNLGHPEPQDAAGNLLHDVRDTGRDLSGDDIRSYQTNLPINYHNDGADAFMLLCYRAAGRGGSSRLVSAVSVFNIILQRQPELATVLQQSFHFDARGQQSPGAPPYQRIPIYSFFQGHLNVLYKREYIDLAQRFPEVPELTPAQVEALDLMDEICDELAMELVMEPGDIIVANNYDVLHARSAFEDIVGESVEGRHMLRLWLSLPNGRPLPPAFEHTREFFHSYRRRQARDGQ
ncbi:MAG: TauD/TfdA family dioxygenase [Candidatus Latescibacterota bacterium]|nr:TauD/TfdA family dioxygenase [Candidatus Latescibacterota bacterium]